MQTRDVRGLKMPKNANIICERSLIQKKGSSLKVIFFSCQCVKIILAPFVLNIEELKWQKKKTLKHGFAILGTSKSICKKMKKPR